MIISSMAKNGAILTAFALVTTGLVASINALTADKIAEQEQLQLTAQLQEVLTQNRTTTNYLQIALYLLMKRLVHTLIKLFTVLVKIINPLPSLFATLRQMVTVGILTYLQPF